MPGYWNCFTKSVCVRVCMSVCTCVCVCVYLATYLPNFVCPYKLTHVNNLSGKYSLYTWDKGPKNPTISFCTSKLQFKGGFLFQAKKQVWQLTTDIESAFHSSFSGVLQLKNTEVSLSGSQEMHISSFEEWAWPALKWRAAWRLCWKNFQRIIQ